MQLATSLVLLLLADTTCSYQVDSQRTCSQPSPWPSSSQQIQYVAIRQRQRTCSYQVEIKNIQLLGKDGEHVASRQRWRTFSYNVEIEIENIYSNYQVEIERTCSHKVEKESWMQAVKSNCCFQQLQFEALRYIRQINHVSICCTDEISIFRCDSDKKFSRDYLYMF